MVALSRARRRSIGARESEPSNDREPSDAVNYAALAQWLVPEFEPVKPEQLRCVDIEPRHLSLLDLDEGDCRYPYGGDAEGEAITFCGHPQRAESSYCAAHFHLTLGPGALPERAVSAAPLTVVEAA